VLLPPVQVMTMMTKMFRTLGLEIRLHLRYDEICAKIGLPNILVQRINPIKYTRDSYNGKYQDIDRRQLLYCVIY